MSRNPHLPAQAGPKVHQSGSSPANDNAPGRPTTLASDAVLNIDKVSKRFGDTLANDNISLQLGRGEVLALLGENGAGKTTLMNILFGHYTPDTGDVRVDGQLMPAGRPRAAIAAGVGMVHQHFSLATNLTVLENIMTGTESLWSVHSSTTRARRKLAAIAERFSLPVDPDASISELSVGERQRVEILKALYNDARILILDEPTAVLTNLEADTLFRTLREMAAQGLSLIFISHKLNEVMSASDRVVVIRGGKVVAERLTHDTSKQELAELMVGRRVLRPVRTAIEPGPVVFELKDVSVRAQLFRIDCHIRAGEMLGIIGVSGNGQATLGHLVSGTVTAHSGTVNLFGNTFPQGDVQALVHSGVGRIPEDRNSNGVIAEMSVWENTVLERASRAPFSRYGVIRKQAARQFTRQVIDGFDVRGGSTDHRIQLLSGGNIQKLMLGRALANRPRLLIAAQPTRGLDEGAIAAVHTQLLQARADGAAVLLISEDLDEVMNLADRIQAIVRGRLSSSVAAQGADAQTLGLMMSGDWLKRDTHAL